MAREASATLREAIRRTLSRLRAVRRGERALAGGAIVGLAALTLALLDAWAALPVWGRQAAGGAMALALIWGALSLRLDARTRRAGPLRAAAMLERALARPDHPLVIGVQMEELSHRAGVAGALARRAVGRADALAQRAAVARAVDRGRLWRRALLAGVVWGSLASIALVEPRLLTAAGARLLDPEARLPAWSRAEVTVRLPEEEIRLGDDARIEALVRGGEASSARLLLLPSDRAGAPAIEAIPMRRVQGAWRATVRDLREPVHLVAETDVGQSRPVRLDPAARPRITGATVRIEGKQGDRVEAVSPGEEAKIDLTVGERLTLRAVASMALGDVDVEGAADAQVTGNIAEASTTAGEPGERVISLRAVGASGLASEESILVRLRIGAAGSGASTSAGEASGEGGDAQGAAKDAQARQGAGAGESGADVALRDPAAEIVLPGPDAPIGVGALMAIETRARDAGALAPGIGVRRVPEAYRARVGAYFLRLLREETGADEGRSP